MSALLPVKLLRSPFQTARLSQMLALRSLFYLLLKYPIKVLVRCKIVPVNLLDTNAIDASQPTFYVLRYQSASDLLALQMSCKRLNLPDPLEHVEINGISIPRAFCLEKTSPLFPKINALFNASMSKYLNQPTVTAISQGFEILKQHQINTELDAQLIPVNFTWGRAPTKEKAKGSVGSVLADQESPTWLRKMFIVLFLGRNTLARFSDPVSFRYMTDKHGSDEATAHKLLRIARFHFHRQTIAATGPRLMARQQMFTALFANPALKRVIDEEAQNKQISKAKVKKQALAMMLEISGDYRDSMVRLGERILHRLWKRLYSGIEVNNAQVLRDLAQEGHEIIYVPCHRSHMDYLLLTYVIYHQGLVTPRIAAGINLSFWPAGPIFRKAGAFFIRRSFKGNRLYSTIFREYLGLLFERGYSVKYYTEGGRSRTGRLLTPKTGMIAMTIQSLLRGIDRPLTLVPVYLGYEHVMEVGTYHKELSGGAKKGESILGVIKAIKNLRNYGKGYVNFGQPININQFLNEQVPDWKSAIDPIEPQKPDWLIPSVNQLADNIMTKINQSAALNGVALVALILSAAENKALAQAELETQLDFFLNIQRNAAYSESLTVPSDSGAELLAQVIALGKVTLHQDSFGAIVSLTGSAILEMRYYRNNILHTFMLPSILCRLLNNTVNITSETLVEHSQILMSLVKAELFLWQNDNDVAEQVDQILQVLQQSLVIKQNDAGFWSLINTSQTLSSIHLMAECCDETLQRFAIIISLVSRLSPISKSDLEEKIVIIAKRLSVLNNINAPEFVDIKAQASLINTMQSQGYIDENEQGKLSISPAMQTLKPIVNNLVDIEVLQSIVR
jgi:glycerol-3-phosphate O-acyltransferase